MIREIKEINAQQLEQWRELREERYKTATLIDIYKSSLTPPENYQELTDKLSAQTHEARYKLAQLLNENPDSVKVYELTNDQKQHNDKVDKLVAENVSEVPENELSISDVVAVDQTLFNQNSYFLTPLLGSRESEELINKIRPEAIKKLSPQELISAVKKIPSFFLALANNGTKLESLGHLKAIEKFYKTEAKGDRRYINRPAIDASVQLDPKELKKLEVFDFTEETYRSDRFYFYAENLKRDLVDQIIQAEKENNTELIKELKAKKATLMELFDYRRVFELKQNAKKEKGSTTTVKAPTASMPKEAKQIIKRTPEQILEKFGTEILEKVSGTKILNNHPSLYDPVNKTVMGLTAKDFLKSKADFNKSTKNGIIKANDGVFISEETERIYDNYVMPIYNSSIMKKLRETTLITSDSK